MIDYQKNYQQRIDPHAGGSFIGQSSEGTPATAPKAPSADDGAETMKRRKLLQELQQALAGLPSEKALEILDKQLPQDYPQRNILLGQLAEALDAQAAGRAADAYVQRMMAQQPRLQPAPAQQPDRRDYMSAEYDDAPVELVPQEPAEENEPVQEAPQEEPDENAVQLFEQFAQFVDGLTDQQKEQLAQILVK